MSDKSDLHTGHEETYTDTVIEACRDSANVPAGYHEIWVLGLAFIIMAPASFSAVVSSSVAGWQKRCDLQSYMCRSCMHVGVSTQTVHPMCTKQWKGDVKVLTLCAHKFS